MRRWIPALCFFLAAASANAQTIRLRGTVVSPDVVTQDAVVTIQGDRITGVTPAGNAQAVDVGGVIFPGLIDLHNHLTWNVMPNWHPPRLFTNRYEWQDTPEYAVGLSGPYYALFNSDSRAGCDMNRFGEVKALVNGATSAVGSLTPPSDLACIKGLVRNLDFASGLYGSDVDKERLRNVIFPFEPRKIQDNPAIYEEDLDRQVKPDVEASPVRAVVMHVGEGTDSAAAREFRQMRAHDFVRPGVSVIHGVAFNAEQIRDLAKAGVGLIWSPHSNFTLYGKTADILTALRAKMTVAVAPDWSPSGSAGMLEELQFAYRYFMNLFPNPKAPGAITDKQLVAMSTINPAKLAAIDTKVGSLAANKMADLIVMKERGASAYQSLLMGNPADVRLVMIAGEAVYGDQDLMKRLSPPNARFESITICGVEKLLHIVVDPA